ncbi:hypothetical protein [Romboutsia maritimum]|uniref:hypothetical protein n=1 Tax=Romboutsia maritimum TaxID=2020948 RepID=UPI001FB0AFAC|nr:hypothetical protein [Romboutsia maritimum]
MDKNNFFDNYFKLLTLLFWPIILYKWLFIANESVEYKLFIIFAILSIIYIISFLFIFYKDKNIKLITILYRISTLLAFLFTLGSFLLFPKNLFWLYLKMLFLILYFYFSCVKVSKYKIDEGVVGIIGSILLLVITIFY